MINDTDLHTLFVRVPMPMSSPSGVAGGAGMLQVEYEVRRYTDVRNLQFRRGYRIWVRQRLILPNDGASLMGAAQVSSYTYCPLLTMTVDAEPGPTIVDCHLVDISPRTLDASVSTSQIGGQTSDVSQSTTHTSGSSTSNVNTYMFGINTGSESSNGSFSSDARSDSLGNSTSRSMSTAMSIKDWSSYASVNATNRDVEWVWAQTFPWDVITYHYTDDTGAVTLPPSVASLLFPPPVGDLQIVNPPSQIALFGIDVATSAEWLCTVDGSGTVDEIKFAHIVAPYCGFHGLKGTPAKQTVTLVQEPEAQLNWPSPMLDLPLLALDPVPLPGGIASALIGFVLTQFVTRPSAPDGFAILSGGNTLLIRGDKAAPFQDPVSADAPMTVALAPGASATFTAYFKIADEESDYTLFIKHWKTDATGVLMTVVVNGGAPITRLVDTAESGEGSDNISRIYLRRRSFSAAEYFDYLLPGLNTVQITLTRAELPPAAPVVNCGYAIRSLAIT